MLFKKNIFILFFTILITMSFTANAKSTDIQYATIKNSEYSIRYPNQVNLLLNQINSQQIWTNLTLLTNFPDRSSSSDNGLQAAYWIKAQVEKIINDYHRKDISIEIVETPYYKQPSVVVKVGNSSQPGIVVGAHLDTYSVTPGKQPGADDNGSGSVAVLEAARALISSNMQFKKPIYFIWYAAQENGLIGSSQVVSKFKIKDIPVEGVLTLDSVGYAYKNESTIWLIDDNVDPNLTTYLKTLAEFYVKQEVKLTRCDYACSDHAVWTHYGYASVDATGSNLDNANPYYHSAGDTIEKLSLSHIIDFTKLAVAFAVELAEPIT